MKNTHIVYLALISLASCNGNKTQTDTPANQALPSESQQPQCYSYTTDKDTISLQFTLVNGTATGSLEYKLFEKDKNSGSISGHIEGDTLFAEYKFRSEGTESVREVAFLKQGNNLIEGYGEMEEQDNKIFFKNRHRLNFDNKVSLTKKACR